jgi:hypothetical protein
MLNANQSKGIVIFSSPEISEDKITLDDATKKVYIYI